MHGRSNLAHVFPVPVPHTLHNPLASSTGQAKHVDRQQTNPAASRIEDLVPYHTTVGTWHCFGQLGPFAGTLPLRQNLRCRAFSSVFDSNFFLFFVRAKAERDELKAKGEELKRGLEASKGREEALSETLRETEGRLEVRRSVAALTVMPAAVAYLLFVFASFLSHPSQSRTCTPQNVSLSLSPSLSLTHTHTHTLRCRSVAEFPSFALFLSVPGSF